MNIKIIAVGKLKEQYLKDAIKEYEKRLSNYCNFSFIEIPAELILNDNLSEHYKKIEAEKILHYIKNNSYIITLEINAKMLSSEEFAIKIKEIENEGVNDLLFIIGGANGICKSISDIAHFKLSFSKMTFTHQLMRLILTEQIYRAFKINSNEPYHR